ncbi:hypothetical protein VULLAG_LOCUS13057 [Vulpes lagopus]
MPPYATIYFPVRGPCEAMCSLLAEQGQSELEAGGGDHGDLDAGLTQGLLSVWAAPQVPGWRPHLVPVQCHPATPGLLPWALREGPAGGGLAGCSEQWCGGSM